MRIVPASSLAVTAALMVLVGSDPLASPQYTAWSAPVNLGPPVNTPFAETGARLSKHGLSLYFSSNRPCGEGDEVLDFNLWVARRTALDAPWGEPECLAINADARLAGDIPYQDREPELSRDEHWLFFVSDRPGSLGPAVPAGGGDIWVSWRRDIFDDHGWTEPVNMPNLNTVHAERTPQYFENEETGVSQLFFASSRVGPTTPEPCVTVLTPACLDIWVVDVANGTALGEATRVDEVSSATFLEAGGAIRHDGKEMFLFRGLPPAMPLDLYTASRPSVLVPWSTPISLGPLVNSGGNDQEVTLSPRRDMLFFASGRAGGVGGLDIWVSTRTKARGASD